MNIKKELLEWGKSILTALVIYFVVQFFFMTTTVYSISMFDTLVEGDRLVLQKMGDVERGDIVSFETDMMLMERDLEKLNVIQRIMAKIHPNKNLIKRVIALPGDTVELSGGRVWVNGHLLDETYVHTVAPETMGPIVIPEGQYFMMGDNRLHSQDSRSTRVGFISESAIQGKAIFRFWPMDRIGALEESN